MPEKQQRVINAAMKEFARKGYKHASTNEIVKEANIGKGRLFHYFNSKKDLFLFLYDYMTKVIQEELWEKIDWNENDIFNRIQQSAMLKLKISSRYPELFRFILAANAEADSEVKRSLEERNKLLAQTSSFNELFKDIDNSKFKQGMDISVATNMIMWTIEGFAAREIEKAKLSSKELDYERVVTDMGVYLEVLKKCFYEMEG